jgi:SAM-dependent methyltransferase
MRALQNASPARERLDLLARLYREQAQRGGSDYLCEHAHPGAMAHHVNVFEWYAPHLTGRRLVLDWGCHHGPDSCLIRHRFGDMVELHACDFAPKEAFAVFREYARPEYKRLDNPLRLPYPAAVFDAVIGSGVLEHTAMDGEALKEVYRVLQPGGLLVITYLPHAYSWSEWRRRRSRVGYHRRLYTRQSLRRLLLAHGLETESVELQGYVPHRLGSSARPFWWQLLRPLLHPVVDALWKPVLRPLRYPFFSQDVLCAVARKMVIM